MAASRAQLINHLSYLVLFYLRELRAGQSLDFHLPNQFINSTKWQEGNRQGAAAVTAFLSPSPLSTPFVNEAGV